MADFRRLLQRARAALLGVRGGFPVPIGTPYSVRHGSTGRLRPTPEASYRGMIDLHLVPAFGEMRHASGFQGTLKAQASMADATITR